MGSSRLPRRRPVSAPLMGTPLASIGSKDIPRAVRREAGGGGAGSFLPHCAALERPRRGDRTHALPARLHASEHALRAQRLLGRGQQQRRAARRRDDLPLAGGAVERGGAARRQRKRPRRPTHPLRAGLLSRRAGRPPLRRQVRLPRLPAPRSRLGEAARPLRAARRHRRRGARGHSSRARGRGCARAAFRQAPRNRPQARCSARGRAPSQRRAARQSGRTRRAEICGDAPGCAGIASRFAARVASRDTA